MINRIRYNKNRGLGFLILSIFILAGLIKFLGHEAGQGPKEVNIHSPGLDVITIAEVKKSAW